MDFTNHRYERLRKIFKHERLPLAFVDMDAFDANADYVVQQVQGTGKTVRLGTKSIRCEALMQRILDSSDLYQGFLTYTVEETAFLADKGHDDFIVAYPTVSPSDLSLLVELELSGKRVSVMVDSPEHLARLSNVGEQSGLILSACMEIDLAYRPLGSLLHLGLRRSPIRTPQQALELALKARELPGVEIDCLMGYEGHIAGVSDAVPKQRVKNILLRKIKNASVKELTNRRQSVVRSLQDAGINLKIVNGGGSGSLRSTLNDGSVSEVTVGSGFYAPALFQHFAEVEYQPAAFFALQIVRKPAPDMIACQGGGYVASGPTGTEKAPSPIMPVGLKYLSLEGAGEVSTPLLLAEDTPKLELGDPVIFQHAKAGELCEHFADLHLLDGEKIVDRVPTYRGEGMNFL